MKKLFYCIIALVLFVSCEKYDDTELIEKNKEEANTEMANMVSTMEDYQKQIEALQKKVKELSDQTKALQDQTKALQSQQDKMAGAVNDSRAAADAAYQEAMRANQRIDNIAH